MKGSVSWVHSKNPQTTCFTDQGAEAPKGGIIRSRSTGLASRTRVQARVWLSPRWGSQCPLRPGELTRYAFMEARLGPGVFCYTNTPPEGRKEEVPARGHGLGQGRKVGRGEWASSTAEVQPGAQRAEGTCSRSRSHRKARRPQRNQELGSALGSGIRKTPDSLSLISCRSVRGGVGLPMSRPCGPFPSLGPQPPAPPRSS